MKTEKMNSDKAIDFLFDQTGKLRTTRVRHQAIVDALSVVKSELRDIKRDAIKESNAAQSSMCANIKLVNENDELRIKLKNEEDRAAAFASRSIELANEVESYKRHIKLIERDIKALKYGNTNYEISVRSLQSANDNLFNSNQELREEISKLKKPVKQKKKFFNAFSV